MLTKAGFTNIKIVVKESAADIIKDWMPGSGAEKYVTSVYVTADKPMGCASVRDNVRAGTQYAELQSACTPDAPGSDPNVGC